MKLLRVALIALLLVPLTLHAQTPAARFVDSARTEIDAAAGARDSTRLAAAIVLLDRALVAFPGDAYLLHYRGYAVFRQVIDRYMTGRMKEALPFIDRASADLEASSARLKWPETYALLASLGGFRIGLDPSLGMTVGPLVGMQMAQASQLGPDNPRVLYLQAMGAFNTPPEYGGGPDQARTLIMRSLEAFKTDKPAPLAPSWGLSEATEFAKRVHAPLTDSRR